MKIVLVRLLLVSFGVFFGTGLLAQTEETEENLITLNVSNTSLSQIFSIIEIESQSDVNFYYKDADISGVSKSVSIEEGKIDVILEELLLGTGYSFINYRDYAYIIVPASYASDDYSASYFQVLEDSYGSDENKVAYDGLVVGDISKVNPSGKATVTGKIIDAGSQEEIIGATLNWKKDGVGEITDFEGNFSANLTIGEQILEVQYIGYQTLTKKVKILSDGSLDLELFKEAISLEEIIISETSADAQVDNVQISVATLTAKEIKKLPSFLGEADVIQSVLIQPGVSSVGEGAIGFNVRGGDVDQNLVIQDEAMIFNTSHALGFFSTFNTDLIKGVDLYKGNLPAKFGGRLASVMDVEMRDGNFEKYKMFGGVGVFSAKLSLEGPIVKDKTSFIGGYRTSYSDWILRQASSPEVQNSGASFYDANLRLTHKFKNNASLVLAGYSAQDKFSFNNDFGFDYSTVLGQLIFRKLLNDRSSIATHVAYSIYETTQNDIGGEFPSALNNNVEYIKAKQEYSFSTANNFGIDVGLSSILYTVNPGQRTPVDPADDFLSALLDKEKGLESAAFAEVKIPLTDRLLISAGLRASAYQFLGPGTVFQYAEGEEVRITNIVDTLSYADNEVIESFFNLEPRFSLRLSLSESSSIKTGYSRTNQYINQIFNSASPTPTSQWQLTTNNIKPTSSHNVSLGYFKNFSNNNYETSLTLFGRQIDHLFEYRDFADLVVNDHLETELLEGEGRAYGIEFSLKKKTGPVNGTLSYTYSRSQRLVDGINKGDWYPSNFDKPHEGSLIFNYQPNQRNTVSFNFTFAQGRPTTPPVAGFLTENDLFVPIYSERNQFRIPNYQRLDFAYTLGQGYKKDRKFKLSWTISVYNLLGRKNAYSVFFERGGFNLPEAFQLSILGNAFPSLTLNFELL